MVWQTMESEYQLLRVVVHLALRQQLVCCYFQKFRIYSKVNSSYTAL